MAHKRESTRNTNDVATVSSGISLNSTTSTTVAVANFDRTYFTINIDGSSSTCLFVKLQAASVDNDKKGIVLVRDLDEDGSYFRLFWEMPPDNIYTGEICAIATSGTPVVYVTEY